MARLIVPVVAILLLAIGVGGGFFAGHMLHPPAPAADKPAEPTSHRPNPDLLYDLPDMMVALTGAAGNDPVLTVSISTESPTQDDLNKLQEYLPRVLDAFQCYLRTLSVADLRGTKNIEIIRSKLEERANAVIAPGKISSVMFRSLAII